MRVCVCDYVCVRAWVSTHSAMGCVRASVGVDSIRHGLIRDVDIVLPKSMFVCMCVCVGAWVSLSLCTSDMSKRPANVVSTFLLFVRI